MFYYCDCMRRIYAEPPGYVIIRRSFVIVSGVFITTEFESCFLYYFWDERVANVNVNKCSWAWAQTDGCFNIELLKLPGHFQKDLRLTFLFVP
jgi:hypothetical protein